MKKSTIAAAMLVIAPMFTFATAEAAHAAAPPKCLKTKVWMQDEVGPDVQRVKVTNTCKTKQTFKVVWKRATDGHCTTLKPGKSKTFGPGHVVGRFDKLKRC